MTSFPGRCLAFQMHCDLKIPEAPIRELGLHLTPGQGRLCTGLGAQIFPKTWGAAGLQRHPGGAVSGTEHRGIKRSSLFWTAPLCAEASLVPAVGLQPIGYPVGQHR